MKALPRTVQVGRMTLEVSEQVDADTARNAAVNVEARLNAIEARATHIDTQRFALQAALELAIALEDAKQDNADDTKATLKALHGLQDQIARVLDLVTTDQPEGEQ